jgi:3-mercaptopyruvate sulfurtransferase SseA
MRRHLTLILLTGIVLSLLACGGTPAANPQIVVEDASDVQRISPQDAKTMVDSDQAVLYDARALTAFQAAHAAGAISFPATEAAARAGELPADKSLVFY